MLRIAIYTTLIAILMLGAASAQTDKPGVPGYSNALRTDLEKKTTKKLIAPTNQRLRGVRTQKNLIRGPMSGQLHQRRPRIKIARPKTAHGEPPGVKREAGEDRGLTAPNGWRGGLVCRVLSAEPVLGLAIYEALFKSGVGAK